MRARTADPLRRRWSLLPAGALAVGLALAGCTSGGSSASGSSDSAAGASTTGSYAAPSAAAAAPSAAASAASGAQSLRGSSVGGAAKAVSLDVIRTAPDAGQGRDIIRTAELTVRVKDVAAATEQAQDLATGSGGLVFAEEASASPGRPQDARTTLTLKVPPAGYAGLLEALGGLGTRLRQTQHAEDVTGQVVDVASRVASQQRAVAQLRALLDRADTVGQVVQVEGQLARREADLESLQAQRKALAAQTALATVTATLVGTPRAAVAPVAAPKDDRNAFVTGLTNGWDAFTATLAGVSTVLGALLPFLGLALVLGIPTWLVVRRLRRRTAPPSGAAAS